MLFTPQRLGLAIALISLTALTTTAQIDLGMRISSFKKNITDSSSFISISRSDIKLCYKLQYNNVKYQVTLTQDRRIDFMLTSDLNFASPEGVKVNTKFGTIANASADKVNADERWWTKYMKLQSGWYAAFKSDQVINKDSQVLYFFKKRL